jgi:hypothetical protein
VEDEIVNRESPASENRMSQKARATIASARPVPEDSLQLKELVQPRLTPFAAVTGLLVATKASTQIRLRTVDASGSDAILARE